MKVTILFDSGETNTGFKVDGAHALYQYNKTVYLVKVDESNKADDDDSGLIMSDNYKNKLTAEAAMAFAEEIKNMSGLDLLKRLYSTVEDDISYNLI